MELREKVDWPPQGRYVVAVSGGVDSVVLLHLLQASASEQLELVVAHADHGWRNDSASDAEFVRQFAKKYGLQLESTRLNLESKSEAKARLARYGFLSQVKERHQAKAIITAHHYDDRVETAILNLMRGTGIQGLVSLQTTDGIVRPLLNVSKKKITDYARKNGLQWREDASNQDLKYARNRVRQEVLPRLRKENPAFDQEMAIILRRAEQLSESLNASFSRLVSQDSPSSVSVNARSVRQLQLPGVQHLLAYMARQVAPGVELDNSTLAQSALQLKTGRINRLRKLKNQLNLHVESDKVILTVNREAGS